MKSKILEFLALGLLALPSVGHTALVTISGQGSADGDWNVTTVTGTFLPSNYASQPWWGFSNEPVARAFAAALGGQLGYPNTYEFTSVKYAPFFAYNTGVTAVGPLFIARTIDDKGVATLFEDRDRGNVYTWAVAERVTTSPPPVPLPAAAWLLLSGLAGLGVVSRRKRA